MGGGGVWGLFEGEEGGTLRLALAREAAVAVTGCLGVAILLAIIVGAARLAAIPTIARLALGWVAPILVCSAACRVAWHLLARRR